MQGVGFKYIFPKVSTLYASRSDDNLHNRTKRFLQARVVDQNQQNILSVLVKFQTGTLQKLTILLDFELG